MMHVWVIATCCYVPGLLLIAEQCRRAALRNAKKVTFTKVTDKRNDKQPLLKEGGTLADAYSSLIVLLQFGRNTCGDIEATLWLLFALLMMALCTVRLCYMLWIGEEVTESWTVAVVVLLMSFKITHRWWAVRNLFRDFSVTAQAHKLSSSQRSDEGKDAATKPTTERGFSVGDRAESATTTGAAELCELMAQAVEEHPELPDNFDLSSILMMITIGTLTFMLVVTSLGCNFTLVVEGSWCEDFDLAQASVLDRSVAIWYFVFGMIMLTTCTVWDTLIVFVYPAVAEHHIRLVCGRIKTQLELPQMCEQAEGFAKLVQVNKSLCNHEAVTQACETINSFLLLVVLCETDLGSDLSAGDAINAWAWFIVFMFLSATQLIALGQISNSFADEVVKLKCSDAVLTHKGHQEMFEHLLPAWHQRVKFKLWFGIGLTIEGAIGFLGSLVGFSVLALSGLS